MINYVYIKNTVGQATNPNKKGTDSQVGGGRVSEGYTLPTSHISGIQTCWNECLTNINAIPDTAYLG